MSATLAYEWIEQRALAGLLFVDSVTGVSVGGQVTVQAPALGFLRRRNGDLVVMRADGMAAGGTSYPLDILPLTAAYAPRRAMLPLPRNANPAASDSIFLPATIPMLPGPGYPLTGSIAVLRVNLRRSTDSACVGGALIRLSRAATPVLAARAITDVAGDALLAIAGVPLSSAGPGATVVSTLDVSIDMIVDPALAQFTADADLDAARIAARAQINGFIDPDDLEARLAAGLPAPTTATIGAGRATTLALSWTPP